MSAGNIALLCFAVFVICYCSEFPDNKFIANLDDKCMDCICHAATGCDEDLQCVKGYCGPFKISKVYWVDTGRVIQDPSEDPERNNAFQDCAFQYHCAARMVLNYMEKFGRDCNDDGVTDCMDYLMLHFNGGAKCQLPLERTNNSLHGLERFNKCYGI